MTNACALVLPKLAIRKPTSSLAIIRWVRKHILEDARRIRMGLWVYHKSLDDPNYGLIRSYPSCNTVACEGGWMTIRMGVPIDYIACGVGGRPVLNGVLSRWSDVAELLAGFSDVATRELYDSFLEGEHYSSEDGSEEQAVLTAKFLSGYMKRWEKPLSERMIGRGGVLLSPRAVSERQR